MSIDMRELARWDNFYVIVGSAAGALIGLQFVVLTLISDKPPEGVAELGAAYGSPTIVHFSATLLLAAVLHVPWNTITFAAVLWGIMGLGGIVYTVIVTHRLRRPAAYQPVFEDWLFHCLLPILAYATLSLSALAAYWYVRPALFCVGAAALLLLFSAIHNAWDSVSYHVFTRRPPE